MRIFQIIPDMFFGGAEIMLENLTYALRKKGEDVTVVVLFNKVTPISKRLVENGVRVIFLDIKPGLDISQIGKLIKLFKAEKPDVVHTHRHCTIYAMPAAILCGIKAKIHTVHNIAVKENIKIHRIFNRVFFRCFGAVPVALSKNIQHTIKEEYNIAEEKIPVIFNGIVMDEFKHKENQKLHNPIRLIHVGRFTEQKNHKTIVDATVLLHKKYQNIELSFWGTGELKNEIESYIAKNSADGYIFIKGTTDAVNDKLRESDIFLLPSVYEGVPITVIEAMATGIPMVTTPVGGIPDMVSDNVDVLFAQNTPESIAQRIEELILSEDLRNKLSKNGLKNSVRFSAEVMAENYINVYRKAVYSGEK